MRIHSSHSKVRCSRHMALKHLAYVTGYSQPVAAAAAARGLLLEGAADDAPPRAVEDALVPAHGAAPVAHDRQRRVAPPAQGAPPVGHAQVGGVGHHEVVHLAREDLRGQCDVERRQHVRLDGVNVAVL